MLTFFIPKFVKRFYQNRFMYKRLPTSKKIELIKRVKSGENVSSVCKDAGISRVIFYKWFNNYRNAGVKGKKNVLSCKVASGRTHWKKLNRKIEQKVLASAIKNPSLSPRKIAGILNISAHGVWNVLKANNLNTGEKRLLYIERNGRSLVRENLASDKITMIRRFEAGEKATDICRDFNVSRTIFYRWLKRYQGANKNTDILNSLRPAKENHWKFVSGASEIILKIVIEHPEYSHLKISKILVRKTGEKILGSHGVYNCLKRLNLNTYQRRLAFAKSQTVVVPAREEEKAWSFPLFGRFEIISVIPPPIRKLPIFSKTFLSLSSACLILSSILIFLLKTISQAGNITSGIGTIFALFSLIVGMFFFLYSFKSYLTIGIVLSFSRQKEEKEEGETGPSFWGRIFGISISIDRQNGGKSAKAALPATPSPAHLAWQGGKGLQPDLSHITLERKPFVSIHLATYNEKRVINRLLTAATSMDYENYEVIVADDSTDETIDILRQWEKHPKVKIIHRETRQGYKGAALSDALKKTDPRAEFVVVFDADFIPYPDTITQFLKYFKAVNGNLNSQTIQNTKQVAVQGYQWHVLNKSENWITRGVRTEYSGSYVLERSGAEIYGGLKQIAGSVYMITKNALSEIGWGTSITEDFQLTLKLYEAGYKVIYTPYVQAPSECVSTIKRLIRQRMRWAEGHSFNVKKMFIRLLFGKWINQNDLALEKSSKLNSEFNNERAWVKSPLTFAEKLELVYISPYYFQAFMFMLGTFSWLMAEVVFKVQLPFWTEVWGWSLVFTNLFALPLMNLVGLFLEEAEEKDYIGLLSFIALSYIVAPFQGYAALKGFLEKEEGPWFRTPKTGRITDALAQGRLYRFVRGILGKPAISPVHANKCE